MKRILPNNVIRIQLNIIVWFDVSWIGGPRIDLGVRGIRVAELRMSHAVQTCYPANAIRSMWRNSSESKVEMDW